MPMTHVTVLVWGGNAQQWKALAAALSPLGGELKEGKPAEEGVDPTEDPDPPVLAVVAVAAPGDGELRQRCQEAAETGAPVIAYGPPGLPAPEVQAAIEGGARGYLAEPVCAAELAPWLADTATREVPTEVLERFAKLNHAVNNPLQGLYGAADLLGMELPPDSRSRVRLKTILRQAKEVGRLVSEASKEAKACLKRTAPKHEE